MKLLTGKQSERDGRVVSRQAAKLKSSPNELNDPQMHNQLSRSWMDERLSGDKKRGGDIFHQAEPSRPPRHRSSTLGSSVGGLAVNHAGCCLTLWGVAVLPLLRLSFMSSAVVDEKN